MGLARAQGPGAGKSSLAFPLAAELGYSLVTKDLVKEALHEVSVVEVPVRIKVPWTQLSVLVR